MRWKVLALLLTTACTRPEAPQAVHSNAPVIIISIDTLRADRLPAYGYGGVETPHIDALRRDSILFRNAYAQVPLTLPSHVSLLTGLLPPDHGVRNNIGYAVDTALPSIPRLLQSRGYRTGAAVSAYVLRGSTGIASGFDFYDDAVSSRGNAAIGSLHRSGRRTVEIATSWIREQGDRPFFFMLHLFEPHSPYEPEEPFRSRYSSEPYDGEIATADAIAGTFIDSLKSSGVYDRAIVFLLSDHGEGLGDHGEPEHGVFVYREAIHVPLLLKLPHGDRGGEVVSGAVALTDVFPTIASLVGAPAPSNRGARSLLAPPAPNRRIYSESLYGRIHLGWSELLSLVDERFHFIEAPRPELYDLGGDPGEKTNVLASERRVFASMREELASYATAAETPAGIDPEEARKLAALGYLSSTAAASSGPRPDPKDRIGEIAAMVRASDLLRRGAYPEAITAFREIVEANPRLSDAWNQLGTAHEEAGQYEEAAEVYRRAIDVAPELAGELGLRRGALLLRLERPDEAERHARLAAKTNASGMHMLLARIALAGQDYVRAETEARAAAEDSGSRLAARVLLAQGFTQQGKLGEALALVEAVEREAQREGIGPVESLQYVRGDVLGRMERYDEAVAAFRREIAAFPRNRQTYANLYLVYMVTDRPEEAEGALEEMVRANPGRAALLFAARTVEAVGDARGAARWRQRAR
ncbi:MAG TPA: sulfatase-like hydrolase/transferase [Thermoanaerobaculia bacterium]|nr:sulfatase-like hydrolase/transferase [Thermoanaerobaculia bacterium]